MKPLVQKYDETHMKIYFPCCICTVRNDRVEDMLALHKALRTKFAPGKLGEIIANMADAWF